MATPAEFSGIQPNAATDASPHPKFFSASQYALLCFLCDAIIPADEEWGGAMEAGVPEFIDLVTSENPAYRLRIGGGLMWLDSYCHARWGHVFLEMGHEERSKVLTAVAWRKNRKADPALQPGIELFAFLRKLTADAFFTSEVGIRYLRYLGNTRLDSFPGCPPLPGQEV